MELKTVRRILLALAAVSCVLAVIVAITRSVPVAVICFVSVIALVVIDIAFYRCPSCGEYLDMRKNKRNNHCPCCGEELDI